jgi:hypothetical protein
MLAFALTIFTSAFLLFQVQPLIGKFILPWFGGTPGVWTTCMLFFQLLLLGGYAYAHFLTSRFAPRRQVIVHGVLLVAALALLPITPRPEWKPGPGDDPIVRILLLLTASLGLPYLVLSSTGPLMQAWFSRTHPGASPYRLYALSNIGSLLALVSYPFYFESHFTRSAQAQMWQWGLVLFVLFCGWCAWRLWKQGDAAVASTTSEEPPAEPPTRMQILLWLALPACASVLLLATTNKLCQDVAVIPFLWVLPLALYLLTFIICFDSPSWYSRPIFLLAMIPCMAAVTMALFKGTNLAIKRQVIVYSGMLFVCCMFCHGELYRARPHPRYLTFYYLMIAAGGALGGLLVAIGAPLLLNNYHELSWGLWLCGLLACVICLTDRNPIEASQWLWLAAVLVLAVFGGLDWSLSWLGEQYRSKLPPTTIKALRWGMWVGLATFIGLWVWRKGYQQFKNYRLVTSACLFAGLIGLSVALWLQAYKAGKDSIFAMRNFYGSLAIFEYNKGDPESHYLLLQHGRITHGLQYVSSANPRRPTSYYCTNSGVALAWNALPADAPKRLGVVGLGTGTLSAFGDKGDYVRIYEINPAVTNIALTRFTYVPGSPATVELAMGDARLSMESELSRGQSQQFDLLALDAFSSDAIPLHLLTTEAIGIYQRHLKPDGILAVHISNRYLNLLPVVERLAEHFHLESGLISDDSEAEPGAYASSWVLVTKNADFLKREPINSALSKPEKKTNSIPLWTDDYASLFPILK